MRFAATTRTDILSMPVTQLSALPDRTPRESVLWRFLDRYKFDDLLETRELHFCRADCFNDDEEGIPPISVLLQSDEHPLDIATACALKHQVGWHAQVREQFYMSCWHRFREEELKLWDGYRSAVAIVTTVRQLEQALRSCSEDISMFSVRYDEEAIESPNLYQIISYKRANYSWEREFRCVISCFKGDPGLNRHIDAHNHAHERPLKSNPPLVPLPTASRVRVDLQSLVNQVVLGPRMGDGEREAIRCSVRDIGPNVHVVDSALRPPSLLVLPEPSHVT